MSTQREPGIKYTPVRGNDPLAELVERANQYWREHKQTVSSTEITNACNAISGILQSFPL